MLKKAKGFTLIELIMVIVIIGILVLVALPRYYANIKKARKAQVVTNLSSLRDLLIAYYTVYNGTPTPFSGTLTVSVDGETIMSVAVPTSYTFASPTITASATADGCTYTMNYTTGVVGGTSATCP